VAKQRIIPIVYKVDYSQVDKSTQSVKKAEQATDKLNKEIKETEAVGTKSFGNLKNAILASGVIAIVGGIAKKVLDIGIAAEQTAISFNTFLGSAEKGKKLLQELTKFAIVTPFTPDQVNKAAKSLLAFGVEANKIIPTLKMIGDVSSGTGKDLAEMAIIFGQIRSTGRLMGQDLLQLINAGFNPLQIISQKTGKSVGDLKKDMEKGLITFDMVEQAFKDATSAGGLFFNLMEKQSQSLGGILSTIQGNLEEIAKGLFEDQSGAAKELAQSIATLTANTDLFVNAINAAIKTSGLYWLLQWYEASSKAADETERLRKEELRLQLTLAKGDLEAAGNNLNMRAAAVKKIIDLSRELNELPQGTTEDPLPWVTDKKAKTITDNSDAVKKLAEAMKFLADEIGATDEQTGLFGVGGFDPLFEDSLKKLETFGDQWTNELKTQADEELEIQAEKNRKLLEEQQAAAQRKREIEEDAFNFAVDAIGGILLANTDSYSEENEALQAKYDEQLRLAGDNQNARARIEQQRAEEEKRLRQKQFEDEKKQSTRRILIETVLNAVKALGLPPIPGANWVAAGKATAYGLLAAGLSRRYAKGSEVGIDGPGTTKSDSIPAMLSKGETVMSYEQTESSKGILKAIKAKKLNDQMIEKLYRGKAGTDGVAFSDKRIVEAIKGQKQPDYTKIGSYVYEIKSKNRDHKQFIRKSYLS